MKRIALFLLTNLGVMLVLGLVVNVLGLNRFLSANGLSVTGLLGFSLVMGFGGAFISLLISKPMAKWTAGVRLINDSPDPTHRRLVATVERLARQAGVRMPEVGIYEGPPNAFATGAFKNSALIAVSTGLLQAMPPDEVEAVLGHEIAHVANGDMVTMTLIQGVMNTFVVFLSRVIGLRRRQSRAPQSERRPRHRVLRHHGGDGHPLWRCRRLDRRVVLPSAGVSSRRRCCQLVGKPPAHDQRIGTLGEPRPG